MLIFGSFSKQVSSFVAIQTSVTICLKGIKDENPCHLGIRNYQVFSLNHAHVDVNFIEDVDSALLETVRNELNGLFWQQYSVTEPSMKKVMMSALYEWMQSDNPVNLINLVDPKKTILSTFQKLLLKNGMNPVEAENLYKKKLDYISFACDIKIHPELANLHAILSCEAQDSSLPNTALQHMQQWIKKEFEPGNLKQENIIRNFQEMYAAQNKLNKEKELLILTGHWDHFTNTSPDALLNVCNNYFKTVSEAKSLETCMVIAEAKKSCHELEAIVASAKQDTLKTLIENFFARWLEAYREGNIDVLKELYILLLRETYRDKIVLKDENITKLIADAITESKETKENIFPISPYLINRVLLHAIVVNPDAWSEIFYNCALLPVYDFICNKLKNTGIEGALKAASYSPDLVAQIKYLIDSRISKEDKETPQRPDEMILLLPHQVQTREDWMHIFPILSEKDCEMIYAANALRLDRILIHQERHLYSYGSLHDALNFVPFSQRRRIITDLIKNEKLRVPLRVLLDHIAEEEKPAFIKGLADKNIVPLLEVHEELALEDINTYLVKKGKTPIAPNAILPLLPSFKDDSFRILIKIVSHLVERAEQEMFLEYFLGRLNEHGLFHVLPLILNETKIDFRFTLFNKFMSIYIKETTFSSLNKFMLQVPQENRLDIMRSILPTFLKRGQTSPEEYLVLCKCLSEDQHTDLLAFLKGYYASITSKVPALKPASIVTSGMFNTATNSTSTAINVIPAKMGMTNSLA